MKFIKYIKIIIIVLLLSFLSVGCNIKFLEGEKKLPKSDDKLLYIVIYKFSNDGMKSQSSDTMLLFKPEEKQEVVENLLKAFKEKSVAENILVDNPQYRMIFLYNLDPKPKEVREEFLESDRFEITYKDGLFVKNEDTKEVFKIEGENFNRVVKYLKLLK